MSNIQEITLNDLIADESFFNDLREGNYILVLGAGFSFGIPSMAELPIPVVKEFVKITNNKFTLNINEIDYNRAALAWQEYIEEKEINETEEAKRFNEFKNLLIVDETKFTEKELYANILLPKWYHIYTFN